MHYKNIKFNLIAQITFPEPLCNFKKLDYVIIEAEKNGVNLTNIELEKLNADRSIGLHKAIQRFFLAQDCGKADLDVIEDIKKTIREDGDNWVAVLDNIDEIYGPFGPRPYYKGNIAGMFR
jgi:hypothetical protein